MESTTINPISPAEYNELLKHIELCDIFLKTTKAELNINKIPEPAEFEFSESPSIIEHGDDKILVQVQYSLKAKCKKQSIFNLSAKYSVVFRTTAKIPEEFFEIFNKLSLPLQTFPYFRELVNSTISRMGLPSLVLPLRKNLIGGTK